ncbi:hypothetical protein [Vibrio atlanticus]|uniref:Uncharacterized protein n=1 Tax=Vibrio atlanticus (strain LGP32) TaxID=575788 RepID=B7VPJ8_VIBA3|nr:hypothetical protein [Vibrio atlanticus]CAV18948.1 hypothetical protein VS_1764 [Vibrio atlanticus]
MENFSCNKRRVEFEKFCKPYLLASIEQLFDCIIEYNNMPIDYLQEEYGINLLDNPNRGTYVHNDSEVTIIGRILEDRIPKFAMSFTLKNGEFSSIDRLLNRFESFLSFTLSQCYRNGFSERPSQFGQELIELFISRYYGKGFFDHRNFILLLELFKKLSTSTFEGRNFTTGLILTKSHYAYNGKGGNDRSGSLFQLRTPITIKPDDTLNKRFWYLADGINSYFVCTKELKVKNIFVTDNKNEKYNSISELNLSNNTLMGSDVALRISGKNEISVIGSDGLEFNYKECRWRLRDINQISSIIKSTLDVSDCFIQSLMFYVLQLANQRVSSILWIPKDTSNLKSFLMTENHLIRANFSILDSSHTSTLLRIFSSDGASVIDRDGNVLSYGSIIDISKLNVDGINGTGESVSHLLGKNGLSVKISQDGKISIFGIKGREKVVI